MKPGDPKSKKITPRSAILNQKETRIQPEWSKGVPKATKIEPKGYTNEPKLVQIEASEFCTFVPFTLDRPTSAPQQSKLFVLQLFITLNEQVCQ